METPEVTRRVLLEAGATTTGALTLGANLAPASVLGANSRIRFGVIGCGGMGTGHVAGLVRRANTDNIQVAANGEMVGEFKSHNDGKTVASLALAERRDLEGNFIDAIRGVSALACNAELGAATMVAIKMAVEAYRQSRTMLWDAKREKMVRV